MASANDTLLLKVHCHNVGSYAYIYLRLSPCIQSFCLIRGYRASSMLFVDVASLMYEHVVLMYKLTSNTMPN